MNEKNPHPPEELVQKCNELNTQWLTDRAMAVPMYYIDDSAMWKIEIRSPNGHVLIKHLNPEWVHGHTLLMAVEGITTAANKGYSSGKAAAIKQLAIQACELLGVNAKHVVKN